MRQPPHDRPAHRQPGHDEPRLGQTRAAEQARPDIQQQRGDFLATLQVLAPADLVFVDETGSNLAMARAYARAPRGQRAYATKPVNRGSRVTILGVVGLDGLVATMAVDGFTDGDVFLAFLHEVLVPQLRPGQVVIINWLQVLQIGLSSCSIGSNLLLQRVSPCFT